MEGVFRGLHYKTKKSIEIKIIDGLIHGIADNVGQYDENIISPGLVDLQVNGFNGIDFNQGDLKEEEVVEITKKLWSEGVTNYFPTLITNSDANINLAIKCITQTCEKNKLVDQTIAGIHLEGPFLSLEDGPRGAHPLQYIKAPDWDLFCKWQEKAAGRIKMITLSPEWSGSTAFISKCVASGVVVSIGHTAATPEQIKNSINAGAIVSTHLGNATHLMLPRHSNYIWEQLASDQLWSTIIADGFHLPKSVLKVFLSVKPEKSILISDSTKFAGMLPGTYSSHIGGEIELDSRGKLFMKDNPNMLAGSAQSLRWCVDHLVTSEIASLSTSLEMASVKVMELLGEASSYGLEEGKKADLIIFEIKSNKIVIIQTIKSGEVVYSRPIAMKKEITTK